MDMQSYEYKYVLTYTAKGLICALYFTHKKQFLTWSETVVQRTSCGTRNRGTQKVGAQRTVSAPGPKKGQIFISKSSSEISVWH